MEGHSYSSEVTSVHAYDPERANLFLSFRWLVYHSYATGGSKSLPKDLLLERPVNGHQVAGAVAFHGLHLSVALLTSLASGDLYCKACARLFPQWAVSWKGHSSVLEALLSRVGILVVSEDGAAVGEKDLRATRPFNIAAHLALIDSIMAAVMAERLPLGEVLQAIRSFAVTKQGATLPANHEDALLLWMTAAASSKASALGMQTVADSISSGASAPGLAIALTIASYQPQQLDAKELLSEQASSVSSTSVAERAVQLVKKYIEMHVPHVPFDFTANDFGREASAHVKGHLVALLSELFIYLVGLAPAPQQAAAAMVKGQSGPEEKEGVMNGALHHEHDYEERTVAAAADASPSGPRSPQRLTKPTQWKLPESSNRLLPQNVAATSAVEGGVATSSAAANRLLAAETGSKLASEMLSREMMAGDGIRQVTGGGGKLGQGSFSQHGMVSQETSKPRTSAGGDAPGVQPTSKQPNAHPSNPSISRSILSLQEKWKKESEVKGRLGSSGAVSPVNFSATICNIADPPSVATSISSPLLLSPSRDDPAIVRGDADGRTDGQGSSSASPSSSPSPKQQQQQDSREPEGSQKYHATVMRPQSPFGLQPSQQQMADNYSRAAQQWPSSARANQNNLLVQSARPDAGAWSAYSVPQSEDAFRQQQTAGSSQAPAARPAAWAAYSPQQPSSEDDSFRQHLSVGSSATLPRKPALRSSPLKAFMAASTARGSQSSPVPPGAAQADQAAPVQGGGLLNSSQLRRMYGSMNSLNLAGIGDVSQALTPGRASPGLLLANRMSPASSAHAAAAAETAATRGGLSDHSRPITQSPQSNVGNSMVAGYMPLTAARLDEHHANEGQGHLPAYRQPSWDSNRSFPSSDRPASPLSSGTASSGRTTPAMAGAVTATRKRATWNRVSPAGDSGLHNGAPDAPGFTEPGLAQPSDEELARMKERVMLMELRRKEEAERRRQEKEAEAQRRREEQRQQEMDFERKKNEEKQRRERILEQHQQSKKEDQDKALPLPFSNTSSVQLRSKASPGRAARNGVNRHSYAGSGLGGPTDFYSSLSNIAEHPPMSGDIAAASASSNVFQRLTAPSPSPGMSSHGISNHTQSRQSSQHYNHGYNEQPMQQQQVYGGGMQSSSSAAAMSRYGSLCNLSARAPTPSFAPFEQPAIQDSNDPLRLFVAPSFKSNRSIIINAISHCVLPGAVNADVKSKVLEDIARADAKHLLILFRDARLQYRGVYSFNIDTGDAMKICGQGPKNITEDMLEAFYKYNSGTKSFSAVASTRHLSVMIDAMTIKDMLWQKPIGPATPVRRMM